MLVLTATGVQCETQLPFAGLHQLVRPVLGHLDDLTASQRTALLAAFGLTDEAAPDFFLTALAALDLLAVSAARIPILVLAEDAHWLGQMLYLSHRTVSSHLYRVFPKLGITSRTELRAALNAGSAGVTR